MTGRSTVPISVIVPTRNRRELLADTIDCLLEQAFPTEEYEIIVVDDGSIPPVPFRPGIRVVRHESPKGLNAARNTGSREAVHDVIVFVDDDIDAPAHWLNSVSSGVARYPEAWCFGGPIRLRLEGTPARACARCSATVGETELELGDAEGPISWYVYGANFGLRRSALLAVGEFDETLPLYYDEVEWQDRVRAAGGAIVYLPDAWLWHKRSRSTMRMNRRLARAVHHGSARAFYLRHQGRKIDRRPRDVARSLAHAVHRRCSAGLIEGATSFGVIAGDLARRLPGVSHRGESRNSRRP